ncbi:MAG: 2-phospho-L-lactate guanylyltransferase [Acidimicrobiales bacterium]|jgi:2-phospho-L-lactate guanylyltransferase
MPELNSPPVVLVPIKAFSSAKSRLRAVLDPEEVRNLARRLATQVLEAAQPRRTLVVCDDDEVAQFATDRGVEVVRTRATTLNGAVAEAYGQMASGDTVIVAHADLRDPRGLGAFLPAPGVTIVTDHHGRGTNVLALPAGAEFRFGYGPDSATRHRHECERLALACTVIVDSPWGYDVDEPNDLEGVPHSI